MPSSLGPAEILIILVVALIVLGPTRLPEAGRQVGKALAEVRRWTRDVKAEVNNVFDPDAVSPPPQPIPHTPVAAQPTPDPEPATDTASSTPDTEEKRSPSPEAPPSL